MPNLVTRRVALVGDDGRFDGINVPGEGKTAQLLRRHGITVFSEDQLGELASLLGTST